MHLLSPALLADLDAERVGKIGGGIIFLAIPIGLLAFFIVSLVKAIKTKSGGWIAGAILSGGLALLIGIRVIVAGAPGLVKAQAKVAAARSAAASPKTLSSKDESVSFSVPGDWVQTDGLNVGSILSAQCASGEQCIAVLPGSRKGYTGSLQDYDELLSNVPILKLADQEFGESETMEVNGRPAVRRRITGTMRGIRLVYITTLIQTDDFYYQVIGWTMQSKEAALLPGVKAVADSFKAKESGASASGE